MSRTGGAARASGYSAGPLTRLRNSLWHFGWRRTLQSGFSIIDDWCFDLRFGTDTVRRVRQADLGFDHANKPSAHPYIPTSGRAFRALMGALPLPEGSVFVDYGSGKGKILLLASRMGFRRVLGVEFSPQLHEIAVRNITKYTEAVEGCAPTMSILRDAAEHEPSGDENVFYLFNPFEDSVLSRVADRIAASVDASPRRIWLIYVDPRYETVFRQGLGLAEVHKTEYGGYSAIVLTNQP